MNIEEEKVETEVMIKENDQVHYFYFKIVDLKNIKNIKNIIIDLYHINLFNMTKKSLISSIFISL